MALTRVTSGGIAPGIEIKFDSNNTPTNPALSFQGDTNTGMYQPADNEIAFSTDGVERFRIKANGDLTLANGSILGGTNPDFAGATNVILYVNQSDLNATDSINNSGGNLNKPFKTIERALLEASKRSYVAGAQNDKFEAFTIMVLPGDYEVDNRPGYDVTTNPVTGLDDANFQTNLHRFNPRNGGIIVPRGTSIVGYDLRKTVIRPKYVPSPTEDSGSITNDAYFVNDNTFDGAQILEKGRGYIVEQAYLHIFNQSQSGETYASISSSIGDKCKRDIGYIVDSVISDLREGGNSNSFVAGELYTQAQDDDGVNEVSDLTGLNSALERTATIDAFNFARDVMKDLVDANGDSGNAAWFTEETTGKTITRPTLVYGVDYGTTGGATQSGDCSDVSTAINTLIGITTGILNAPDTYNDTIKKVLPVAYQTSIFKVTGGCYFWQMTFKDAKTVSNTFDSVSFNGSGVPTFTTATSVSYSHHRVVSFTYADQRSFDGELDLYYKRIDAWDTSLDGGNARETRLGEYQIVGDASSKQLIDTVNSCSPYIFNCSLRSVLGLCGMHTDGSKVKDNSFKSMVVAQFTGISLQRDTDAYWQPHNKSGKVYTSATSPVSLPTGDTKRNVVGIAESTENRGPIFADPDSEYKHDWRHFHIKASNGAFIQVVSVFAVGYADQFLSVNGGDMSITNSNSNFGQISLRAAGSKFKADPPSANGKITALIPPAGISKVSQYAEIYPINADITWEENLGDTATAVKSDWENRKIQFAQLNAPDKFKLYIEIPGVEKETDIPELVVESEDLNDGSTKIKRFLTYGSNNNFNLFRDYYSTDGVVSTNDCKIVNQVENNTGSISNYQARVTVDYSSLSGTNAQRIGYQWDNSKKKVYFEINPSNSDTVSYISDFLFSSVLETTFVTEEVTNDDGSTNVVSKTVETEVLQYFDSFPGSVSIAKLVDSRASVPSDLLWRVKYVIPKGITQTPKPPEKRFIIKGTNLSNDENGRPYTNYRFTVWDVQEVQTWERDTRDGEYYLTILRADIDKFADGDDGSGYENTPFIIKRQDSYEYVISDNLSEMASGDKNYRVSSNVNYLYPSTNEDSTITDPRTIWNPPQTDSRVIVERLSGTGLRPKDVSVPNKKYYNSAQSGSTPFYDVPAMFSLTAEACNRLVHALDLCYIQTASVTTTNVKVAKVVSWDGRLTNGGNNQGYYNSSVNIYGTGTNAFRYGSTNKVIKNEDSVDINKFGITDTEENRKIPVCGRGITATINANNNNDSDEVFTAAPVVPLLRPSILRASSHTWEYIGIGPGNYSTGFPNLQTRVLKGYEQFIAQGYENAGGFVASSGTNSDGDFYIGNQVIQAGGQSSTTLNVPKVRKSSESNVVDISDLENRISNSVINVIPSANKSSAQQNLLKGLSNFFTTARLTVTDRANIQTLFVTDRLFISNSSVLNGEKFPEGGPEGYGFTKGARPEKTGFIATDTNDRLYVSPKYLDAWRIKKKILSASNINLDNNRIYVEPLSRSFISSLPNSDFVALGAPIEFTGTISSTGAITSISSTIGAKLYEGMRIRCANASDNNIVGTATISTKTSNTAIQLSGGTYSADSSISFYTVDRLSLVDTSGIPPFGRIDIEMSLDFVTAQDYILDGTTKMFLNPNINISLQYDEIDYTNNTLSVGVTQNYAEYRDYVNSVLPEENTRLLHTITRNYSPIIPVINDDDLVSDAKYLQGTITDSSGVAAATVSEEGTHSIITASTKISVDSVFWGKLPTRGAVTIRESSNNSVVYTTFIYYKDLTDSSNKICLLRRVNTQSSGDSSKTYAQNTPIFFTGCKSYISFGDKWTVEGAFIPTVEEITEDVDIESATLYELPTRPIPFVDNLSEDFTESIVPNPVTSKALGANLQTKRAVKTFQPFSTLKQVADFAQDQGFTPTDEVELIMKPGYYKIDSDVTTEYGNTIKFPCKVKINGSGTKKTDELYSKEYANESAGRIGGYSLKTVKSGDSVSFFRSPQMRNDWAGRTDLLYISNINDKIESTGGMNIENVHFLGINDAITRNEILDNSYSSDEYLIRARRKVRKAWYVKESANFPSTEAGVDGGLAFNVEHSTDSTNGSYKIGVFDYYIKTTEFTDSSRVVQSPTVDNTYRSKDARYLKMTFTRTDFSSTNASAYNYSGRFDWMINYVIPGTTLYYMPNISNNGDIGPQTKKTKVLDVKKITTLSGGVTTVSAFEVYVAIFDPTTTASTSDEDMDLVNGVTTLVNGIRLVFDNRNGDEFCTMVYNWCKQKRYQLQPKNFTLSGEGYDNTIYDIPEIFGIIAGDSPDTLNLVIDTHPSKEQGGINSFSTSVSNLSTLTGDADLEITSHSVSPSGGTGAVFRVVFTNSTNKIDVTVKNPGTDYKIGDVVTIDGSELSSIGGNGTDHDITLTIGSIIPDKLQYPTYNLFSKHPSISVLLDSLNEDYSFTIPTFPKGYRRLYGRQNTRYYLLEVKASDIGSTADNTGHNASIRSLFSGFGYSDIDSDETTQITVSINGSNVVFQEKDRSKRSSEFSTDQQFEAIAKYNLWRSGFGYKKTNPSTSNALNSAQTVGRQVLVNYAKSYKNVRKKFPTSRPPVVGNLGATLIGVSGIPGTTNNVTLKEVTIGAMSDANDTSNTYGGGYHGGIISIENGQVSLEGVRFRGNLSLDWSGLLTDNNTRLTADNKSTYGHSVDLLETSGLIKIDKLGNNRYSKLNVSNEDINFKYYTMFNSSNNLYIEPNKLPDGKSVDYDQRTFPITTISAISKLASNGSFNTNVVLDERFLTDEIYHDSGSSSGYDGQNLRFNNAFSNIINAGVPGGHSDSTRDLGPKTLTFTLPYGAEGSTSAVAAEEVAKNIIPNFTEIIRNGNPDSVLATVTDFEYYKKSNVAYFVIKYSGNIEYNNLQNTTNSNDDDIMGVDGDDMSDFKLQLLTKYIPSQRFNYVSTLTTRYIKRSNADGTQFSKYEIGFDDAQNISVFANSKDFTIEKLGEGVANITRENGVNPNILSFGTTDPVKLILETDANSEVVSCDVVSLGLNNTAGEVLNYFQTGSTTDGYKITISDTATVREVATDEDYEMFIPGEVVNNVENSCFLVNNFVEGNLTGIKAKLQEVKSIITPGSYIEYGGQYYKIAYSQPGRPYLGIYRYVNPSNSEDVRTSLVVRLEEKTYNINYTRKRNDEIITRFDLFEDDNVLRYWPDAGRLEIGELELCDFTKTFVSNNIGYRITLDRSNSKFWPSYIHDWDGLKIAEGITPTTDADNPAEAPPNISVGTLTGTSIKLADPVDVTCSTFKRVKFVGEQTDATQYMSKTGILTTNRAYIDIASSSVAGQTGDAEREADANKFEIGQIVSLPWRSLAIGPNNRGSNSKENYAPKEIVVTVDETRGTIGTGSSVNRAGDNKIAVVFSSTKEATEDVVGITTTTDGICRLSRNLRDPHQIVSLTNTFGDSGQTDIYDYIDPLTVCRSIKSISSILGKPHDDNNSATISNVSGRTFRISQAGDTDIGKGIVPGIVVKHSLLPKDTRISKVVRGGSSPNHTYDITVNKDETSGTISGTVTFVNEIYTDIELFHPLLQNVGTGTSVTQFKIVPTFNSEGHPWRRHTEVFTSRISDIVPESSNDSVRLYLSDPFTYGETGDTGNTVNESYSSFINHADSRNYGFISINHGGWSFPRSGGSYFPSNIPVLMAASTSQIKLPNRSGRIVPGDTLKYTYEATSIIQEINRDTRSDSNISRIRLRNSSVEEGDSFIGFDSSTNDRFSKADTFRSAGSYTVEHKRYLSKSGEEIDNYKFGSSSTNSFWDGSAFTTSAPTTKYTFGGTDFFVDIGGGVTLNATQSYSGKGASDLDADTDLGVYSGTGADQNTGDPVTGSLVTTSGAGKDAKINLTVDASGNITAATIDSSNKGTGYEINDWIKIDGSVFNFNNPKYPKDVYLYVSDIGTSGAIESFVPRIKLVNEENDSEKVFGYDSTAQKWRQFTVVSGGADTFVSGNSGLLDPSDAIIVDQSQSGYVYLKATLSGSNEGELVDYRFEIVGGFASGQKLIFQKPKPSQKFVTGTITQVVAADSTTGYSDCTIDSPDNILYNDHPNKSDWLSVSDILVTNSSDLFANDGPVVLRFMHSEDGGDIQFGNYRVWNDYYRNGSQNRGYGVFGSHGWVGNFGKTVNGVSPIGVTSSGALNISWGRQRQNSIWKVAQPIRPAWTHRGTTTNVNYAGAAFTPGNRYFYTNGTNTFYSSSLVNYLLEDNQVFDNIGYANVITHTSNTTDTINASIATTHKYMRPNWYSGRYYDGGFGPVSYQPYQWSSTFDSISDSRIVNKNHISYQLQDLKFRKDNTYGDINWGSGRKPRLSEQMVLDYVQHYSLGPVGTDPDGMDHFIDTGVQVTAKTESGYWENYVLETTGASGSKNIRRGKLVTSFVAGKTYIIGESTNPDYKQGQLYVATTAGALSNVTNGYEYDSKIARGDAIYLSNNGGTTKTFVGFVRYVDGGSGTGDSNNIRLTQAIATAQQSGNWDLYYVRPNGLKRQSYETAYSQDNVAGDNSKGENVLSASLPGGIDYNLSFAIGKRNYNTTPILNTVGSVKPVGNFWWYWGTGAAHRSVRVQSGDLSAFSWSLMNINITRLNPKVHLESAVTVTSSSSSIGLTNVFI